MVRGRFRRFGFLVRRNATGETEKPVAARAILHPGLLLVTLQCGELGRRQSAAIILYRVIAAHFAAAESRRRRKVGPQLVIFFPDMAEVAEMLGAVGRRAGRRCPLLDRIHPGGPILLDAAALGARLQRRAELGDQIGEQTIVVAPPLALQLAMIIMALDRPFERPFDGGRKDVPAADPLLRLAGEIEGASLGAAAKAGDALHGHADAAGGPAGDAAIRERFDIVALPLRRPAVAPVAE